MLWPTAMGAIADDALRTQALQVAEQLEPIVEEGSESGALARAHTMNEELSQRTAMWLGDDAAPDGYDTWRPRDSDVVASIEIPSLSLALPVRLGTSDEVLSEGVGHLPGSSLPVGGPSTHCVLSGHTAYRELRLFDDIGELDPGDIVELHSCAGTLRYRVLETSIVEPTDATDLAIEEGRDLLTLLTCYPPTVNTQRLLVQCERDLAVGSAQSGGIPNADGQEGAADASHEAAQAHVPGWFVAGLCLITSLASGVLVALVMALPQIRLSHGVGRHAQRRMSGHPGRKPKRSRHAS